jgi:queuine/archaeosine tRNA-ribosyltransferase
MIAEEAVEKACNEVGQYTDEQMVHEFDRFFKAQPAVCDFIVELTQESGQNIQELSLFLSYMVFKTIEVSDSAQPAMLQPEEIEETYRETESWMTRVSQAEDSELKGAIIQSLQGDTEPHLLQYVMSELNEPMDNGTELNDEEKGEIFFVLKTVISSLCKRK